jgi:hypothetical protein
MLIHDQLRADVSALDAQLTGSVVSPGDAGWDEARTAWNLAVDQRPLAVAIVKDADDVVAVVDFARERGLKVAAQGTGHNASALGGLEATILVRTHEMRGVTVDPVGRRFRAEAGAVWLDVTTKTAEHGLVPPLGSSPDVGVVGFTLGGGFCWAGRKYGLAANNVLAVEVVLADGSHVRATAEADPDLFWAVRGGAGNFGVVTAIEMELFDEPAIFGASMLFPRERGAEVAHAWRRYVQTLDEDTTSYIRFLNLPPIPDIPEPLRGRSFVNVEVVHLGDEDAGREVSQAIRALGPEMEMGGALDAVALNHFHMDPENPVPAVGGAHMLIDELTPEAIDAYVAVGADPRSPLLLLEIRQLGGALARTPENAGALGRLEGQFATYGAGMAMDADMAVAVESQLEKAAAALAPWDNGARYLNFVEHQSDSRTMFRSEAYRRLQQIRAAVDPDELFQANHPVRSAR